MPSKRPLHWMSEAGRAALVTRWYAGEGFSEIGRSVGVSGRAVSYMFKRMGESTTPAPRCLIVIENRSGYRQVVLPDGRKDYAHRLIAEIQIGRRLGPGEVVHHRDENTANNHASNLEVLSRSAHRIHHHAGPEGECSLCGRSAWYRRLGQPMCRRCHSHVRRYHEASEGQCASSRGCPVPRRP